MSAITSNAVYLKLIEKIDQGLRIGGDSTTSSLTLPLGMYLYVTNYHPLSTTVGLYLVSVAAIPNYNRVKTLINDTSISVSISTDTNTFTVTSTGVFRGCLLRISSTPSV